jgi:SAM-dependent methyltransferase
MSYLKIAEHYKNCFETHGDNHLGVDWPNYEDTLKRYQIMLEVTNPTDLAFDLLDFGCGTAALYEYALSKPKQFGNRIVYSGLDINSEFVQKSKNKFPSQTFYHKDILVDDNLPNFDYIVCNGTFTEKRDLEYDEMFEFFSNTIKKLWDKTNKGIAFNLMSKHVDWERDDLFHVSLDDLGWFLKNNLSRNFTIRNDYGLYEYTTYVYK